MDQRNTPLHDEYLRLVQEVESALARSVKIEREFLDGGVLNREANAACADLLHKRRQFAAWLMENHAALFARSESAFIEVGEMVEIPDGFDGHPNTVYCEWNEMRSKLPAGTKIYVRR